MDLFWQAHAKKNAFSSNVDTTRFWDGQSVLTTW